MQLVTDTGYIVEIYQEKPDLVLPKHKTVIFVNGCFWHGHRGCKYFKYPKSNSKWWKNKIEKTKANDEVNYSLLEEDGWESNRRLGVRIEKG